MKEAHIQSLFALAEPFADSSPNIYDFGQQDVTVRVKNSIPTMLKYRLTPPPDESYSLHRKLSGAFLLCTRLGSKVECKRLFEEVKKRYK